MYLIQIVSCIFLLCHLCFSQGFAVSRDSIEISPRADNKANFTLNGFPVEGTGPTKGPITADDMTRYIDQIIELADYVVDNVQETDAIFLQFFGTADYHREVINVFRRLSGLKKDTVHLKKLVIAANITTEPAGEFMANGEKITPVAEYENLQGIPTLTFYKGWTGLEDFLRMIPGQTSEGQLERFRATRQGAVLHELIRFVGDSSIFGTVLSPFPNRGPFNNGSVIDVYLKETIGEDEEEYVNQERGLSGSQLAEARAYGERNVLLIPQLGDGPFAAIHNADSYTLFAIALLINWNRNFAIIPTHGELVDIYKNAGDFRDPLKDTASPFRQMGEWGTRASVWWRTSQRKEEL